MAHAIHPNHADLHDAEHAPRINCGLVIKSNANQSYATSGLSAAFFTELCRRAGYQPQQFVSRSDLRCGSTIGPIISGELGVRAVDVGAPLLSMHSCREMAGTLDVHLAIRTFQELFRS
jgi:aspartyl aminopeptidase